MGRPTLSLHKLPFTEGEPLWTYNPGEPRHFLSALCRTVDLLSSVERSGIMHGDINPTTILLKDSIAELERTDEVYMIDLDMCCTHESRRIEDVDHLLPQRSSGQRPPSAISPITVSFAAIGKLKTLESAKQDLYDDQSTQMDRTAQDLESLIWVVIYSLYQRAYEISQHPHSGWGLAEQEIIEDALDTDFGNADAGTVAHSRRAMASRGLSSLYNMLPFFDSELRGFVLGLLDLVHAQNRQVLPALPRTAARPQTAHGVDEPLTCESLRRYIVSYMSSEHCDK